MLQYPPRYIHGTILNANTMEFENRTMIPGKVVIPVKIKSIADQNKIKLRSQGRKQVRLDCKPHAVEMGFACTSQKVQGQTCNRLILDLNPRPFVPKIDFHSLYVGLSRVRSGQHLRIMPLHQRVSNLNYLNNMKPASTLMSWLEFFLF